LIAAVSRGEFVTRDRLPTEELQRVGNGDGCRSEPEAGDWGRMIGVPGRVTNVKSF